MYALSPSLRAAGGRHLLRLRSVQPQRRPGPRINELPELQRSPTVAE